MFSFSLLRFHSLLIGPALLPFLFSTSPNAARNDAPSLTDGSYTVHGILFGSFPFSDPLRLVSNGPVSNGTLRTFGRFNGYSQDSFIYEPNYAYVGADSVRIHRSFSSPMTGVKAMPITRRFSKTIWGVSRSFIPTRR